MMKNIIKLLLSSMLLLLLTACPRNRTTFDSSLLIGKWQRQSTLTNGLDCYRYDTGGKGVTWDTGDDVTEAEAQAFTWALNNSELIHYHQGEMGQVVPKTYKVTTLTTSTLIYKDNYGNSYTFTKFK